MFFFVIFTTQLVRKMKFYGVIVSQKRFVNDLAYREEILNQASRLQDKEAKLLAHEIRCLNID